MKFNETGAFILSETKNGERIVSCGGRISTQPGTAVELYKKATDKEKNLKLVSRVVASGHKTILEHHYFNIAFNNVSIFIEQYLIEFRLASFTIKSGRYVNFSSAGFNLPNSFTDEQKKLLKAHYKKMFKTYDKFVAAGIPVEDARFVLPYGLKTNIYMSMNARELVHIICSMVYGRGKYYEEIIELGLQLKAQFDERYPGLIEANAKYYTEDLNKVLKISQEPCKKPEFVSHSANLISGSTNSGEAINEFAKASGYEKFDFETALKDDKQSKLLEHFSYTFKVDNFALIILKHYSRHRMQTLQLPQSFKWQALTNLLFLKQFWQNLNLRLNLKNALKKTEEFTTNS